MIALPTFCDELAAFVISNIDETELSRDPADIIDMIKTIKMDNYKSVCHIYHLYYSLQYTVVE